MTTEQIDRINNDANGNPRYVFHFTCLPGTYLEALNTAKKIIPGCRKFNNKQYGGGIVVSSYNIQREIVDRINDYLESLK